MSAFFLFDGISSSQYAIKIVYNGIHNPVLPPTVERLVSIPTRPGAWDYGATFGPRTITLDCEIYDQTIIGGVLYRFSQADLMTLARNVEVWLDPRKGAKPLILPDDPSVWYARYTGTSDLNFLLGLVTFKLPFLAVDPFPR